MYRQMYRLMYPFIPRLMYRQTNCLWSRTCEYDSCSTLQESCTAHMCPCCQRESKGKTRGYDRCLLYKINQTKSIIGLESSDYDLWTQDVVITEFPDIPPLINQSWACYYTRFPTLNSKILYSGHANNVRWPIFVISITGFLLILIYLIVMCYH